MVIVTGGAGFIGSAFVWQLNQAGIDDILIVDNLASTTKWKNLVHLKYSDYLHKDEFIHLLEQGRFPKAGDRVEAIIHMGACSATTERDVDYLMRNNFHFSRSLAEWAIKNNARFIYASSAATYGNGSQGFTDADDVSFALEPINAYGYSKQIFDLWALKSGASKKIAGLKFFNVFGANEYHKGDMSSVVFKAYHQIKEGGKVKLFRSHRPDYLDGEQKRDFVYIKDVLKVMWWLYCHPEVNGIYNLGTGEARSWNDLIRAVFSAMNLPPQIEYMDMPESLRHSYQYFTQSSMEKLFKAGYAAEFLPLEETVSDYVRNYLSQENPYLK